MAEITPRDRDCAVRALQDGTPGIDHWIMTGEQPKVFDENLERVAQALADERDFLYRFQDAFKCAQCDQPAHHNGGNCGFQPNVTYTGTTQPAAKLHPDVWVRFATNGSLLGASLEPPPAVAVRYQVAIR